MCVFIRWRPSFRLFVSLLMHKSLWPYLGMCVWEWWGVNLILGPGDSGHSEPRGHKKTFLLSVVPIVRHKHCFLQSVTTTLQNAYAPDDTMGAPLVSSEGRRKGQGWGGGLSKSCTMAACTVPSIHACRFEAKLYLEVTVKSFFQFIYFQLGRILRSDTHRDVNFYQTRSW